VQASFYLSFSEFLDQTNIRFTSHEKDGFWLFQLLDKTYCLVPYSCYHKLIRPPSDYYIYQDIWLYKPHHVKSRMLSIFGLNQKLHARKSLVQKLNKVKAEEFLEQNHLMGKAKAAYHYGLFFEDKCLALMSWSKPRIFTDKQVYYRSYELIRFANLSGYTVIGGFSKLLHYFIFQYHPAHIMTYTDNDWGTADSFERLGFRRFGSSQKIKFFVNPVTHERVYQLPMHHEKNYTLHCQNGGSTKWIIDLQK
jgi:hypothetical protein